MKFTAKDKLDCIEREIRYRVRVYGRLVHDGKMSPDKAEHETALMRAIAADYRTQAEKERML